ncbi:MAG: thioredoxin domain-containing protein [Candidatus Nitrosopolaris sp.]
MQPTTRSNARRCSRLQKFSGYKVRPTQATLAAEASCCAADQGKYRPFHDEIYKNSKGEYVAWVTKDILKQFASNVNIPNIKKFSECLDSQNHSNIVEQNDNLASSIGLQATPSLFYYQQGNHSNNPCL